MSRSPRSRLVDCAGESSDVVSGSAGNSFDQNDGNSSDPAALCAGGSVPR